MLSCKPKFYTGLKCILGLVKWKKCYTICDRHGLSKNALNYNSRNTLHAVCKTHDRQVYMSNNCLIFWILLSKLHERYTLARLLLTYFEAGCWEQKYHLTWCKSKCFENNTSLSVSILMLAVLSSDKRRNILVICHEARAPIRLRS